MGVVHLDDHHAQLAGLVPAQVEAGRVEEVSQDPEVRYEGNAPGRGFDTVAREVRPHGFSERPGRGEQVVVVPEGQDVSPVLAHQPQLGGHLVDLVQVQREVPHVVLELVYERARAAMPDLAHQQVRSHAASSSAEADSIAAAS